MAQPEVVVQSEERRRKNFNEVALGYSKRDALEEAKRCPQCADPVCMRGCPLGIDIPGFIRQLREGNATLAFETIKKQNCLPSICGRICSAPCEAACVLKEEDAPIGIRALERFAADYGRSKTLKGAGSVRKGAKIAIIGSGPTGLSAANELARKGCQVTIFESLDRPGGVLRYGIPEFRIPKKILNAEINEIQSLGVDIQTNFYIGQTVKIEELFEKGFSAVLIATGAGIPKFMDIPGTHFGGVYYGEEFLMRINLMKNRIFNKQNPNFVLGERVVVIGSGNTALDCARCAVRYGREVTLIFRRTEEDMRVRSAERQYSKEEGIHFEPLVKPIEILPDENNFVGGLKCLRMDFADENQTGKWSLETVPGSDFILDVDTVIVAIGHKPNALIHRFLPHLQLNPEGTIAIDQNSMTSIPKVFAAGNVVTNAGPIVDALAAGKRVAEQIFKYVSKR